MKELNGRELAGYIKERQAKDVRSLKQARGIFPKLAIVSTLDHPASQLYLKIKQNYGLDIGAVVEVFKPTPNEVLKMIEKLNDDPSVHGIIVQLPLADELDVDEVLDAVLPQKDVDGLGKNTKFDPATPLAINWLLDGYNIELKSGQNLLVGQGRLVGSPLARIWRESGIDFLVADSKTHDLKTLTLQADIIVTATGKPGLIDSSMLKSGCAVVDAGVAEIDGTLKGDLADDVYERQDLILTPRKGGVGPLTVAALFDNTLKAARGSQRL